MAQQTMSDKVMSRRRESSLKKLLKKANPVQVG